MNFLKVVLLLKENQILYRKYYIITKYYKIKNYYYPQGVVVLISKLAFTKFAPIRFALFKLAPIKNIY